MMKTTLGGVLAAILALATTGANAKEDAMQLGTKPEELISAKITVGDLEKSYDFYTRLVGLQPTDPDQAAAARASAADFVEVSLNHSGSRRDPALLLIRRKGDVPDKVSARRTWIAFKTPDVAAAVKRIAAEGYEVRNQATPHGGLIFGIVYDPDGYTVEFLANGDGG
jgi:predicted enzyme related to lactoylglutathione lyase